MMRVILIADCSSPTLHVSGLFPAFRHSKTPELVDIRVPQGVYHQLAIGKKREKRNVVYKRLYRTSNRVGAIERLHPPARNNYSAHWTSLTRVDPMTFYQSYVG
jgi:hypothetical protein